MAAFTLTELLVVIAIIATLAAVLMTVVPRIRMSGNRVQHVAAIKQLGVAIESYASDHADRLPGPAFGDAPMYVHGGEKWAISHFLAPYFGVDDLRPSGDRYELIKGGIPEYLMKEAMNNPKTKIFQGNFNPSWKTRQGKFYFRKDENNVHVGIWGNIARNIEPELISVLRNNVETAEFPLVTDGFDIQNANSLPSAKFIGNCRIYLYLDMHQAVVTPRITEANGFIRH